MAKPHILAVDANFFKSRQKAVGVTNDDLARAIGRDRSVVSHIYSGKRPMRPTEASAFAAQLRVPVEDVLAAAGLTSAGDRLVAAQGRLAEDARPFVWKDDRARAALENTFGFNRPGVDVWTVQTEDMLLGGYRKGDAIVVDGRRPELVQRGDDVIAQVYDYETGAAKTLFRRAEPPFLFALSVDAHRVAPLLIDNDRVSVRGKVIACWREM